MFCVNQSDNTQQQKQKWLSNDHGIYSQLFKFYKKVLNIRLNELHLYFGC